MFLGSEEYLLALEGHRAGRFTSNGELNAGHGAWRMPATSSAARLRQHRRALRVDHPDVPPDYTYRYRASKVDCDACALGFDP